MSGLTRMEIMVLAGDLEHSWDCKAGCPEMFYRDDAGNDWTDSTGTVPHVEAVCSCGYFAALASGQEKMRAMLVDRGDAL
jgi:hypothetical protein